MFGLVGLALGLTLVFCFAETSFLGIAEAVRLLTGDPTFRALAVVFEAPISGAAVLEAPVLEAPVLEAPVLEASVLEAPVLDASGPRKVLPLADFAAEAFDLDFADVDFGDPTRDLSPWEWDGSVPLRPAALAGLVTDLRAVIAVRFAAEPALLALFFDALATAFTKSSFSILLLPASPRR